MCPAQVAANNKGIQLVQELINEYSLKVVQAYMLYIQVSRGCVFCEGRRSATPLHFVTVALQYAAEFLVGRIRSYPV